MKTEKEIIEDQLKPAGILPEYEDAFWLLHNTKTFAVNMEGYSKLLLCGIYGKLSQEQKDILEIIIKENGFLMESLADMFDLLYRYEAMLKIGIDIAEKAKPKKKV